MTKTCAAAGADWQCDRTSMARGPHCRAHYVQLRQSSALKPLRTWANRQPAQCRECSDGTLAALRGLCATHSERLRRHGSTEVRQIRTTSPEYVPTSCACGQPIELRTGGLALGLCRTCYIKSRQPLCAIDGCERRTGSDSGLCQAHWAAAATLSGGRCAIEWCDRTDLSTGKDGTTPYCGRHYSQWRSGRIETERFAQCHCGSIIDRLTRPAHAVQCESCATAKRQRRSSRNWAMTVWELAERDGAVCALGGEPIDMALTWPHPGCPTVDHIIPRSRGGLDEPGNLQLACFKHNRAKWHHLPALTSAPWMADDPWLQAGWALPVPLDLMGESS